MSSLTAVEKTLQGVLAARDGLLALATRLAMSIAEQGEGLEQSDLTLRAVAAELATALRVSDRTVQRRMLAAEVVVERFPAVWRAQGAGLLTAGHARVIVDAGSHIDEPEARAAYAARMIEFARDESPNRVRVVAERIAQQYRSRTLDERHEDARANRGVWVTDHPDAMSELHVLGPSTLIHGVHDRLTQMGKALKSAGDEGLESSGGAARTDPRTLAQRRCDLALDLLLTGVPAGHDTADRLLGAITAQVAVTVPATTLIGATGPAAELSGRAPVDLATARRLAGAATGWDRVLTHPVNGARCSPSTGIVRRNRCGAGCGREISAADSPDAACRRSTAISITPAMPPSAARPARATSQRSADDITCSSIRLRGTSRSSVTGCSNGRARPVAPTSTGRPRRTP